VASPHQASLRDRPVSDFRSGQREDASRSGQRLPAQTREAGHHYPANLRSHEPQQLGGEGLARLRYDPFHRVVRRRELVRTRHRTVGPSLAHRGRDDRPHHPRAERRVRSSEGRRRLLRLTTMRVGLVLLGEAGPASTRPELLTSAWSRGLVLLGLWLRGLAVQARLVAQEFRPRRDSRPSLLVCANSARRCSWWNRFPTCTGSAVRRRGAADAEDARAPDAREAPRREDAPGTTAAQTREDVGGEDRTGVPALKKVRGAPDGRTLAFHFRRMSGALHALDWGNSPP